MHRSTCSTDKGQSIKTGRCPFLFKECNPVLHVVHCTVSLQYFSLWRERSALSVEEGQRERERAEEAMKQLRRGESFHPLRSHAVELT